MTDLDANSVESKVDPLGLRDRVVIVTGASSGMGEACALAFGRAGSRVVAVGRDKDRLGQVRATVEGDGGQIITVEADFLNADEAALPVHAAVEAFGQIDVVVSAAGLSEFEMFGEATVESLERLWSVNARAPYLTSLAAHPYLTDGSVLLYVTSTGAHRGFDGLAAYSASKAAVEGMARVLAVELAPKTRVNVLVPGFVATPMMAPQLEDPTFLKRAIARTPVGFIAVPEDIANAAIFLCSNQSRYVNGATLLVDGGWCAQGGGY